MNPRQTPGATAADPASLVRLSGLRVTAARLAVLRAFRERPHADAESVIEKAQSRLGAISLQTVSDILGAFVQSGPVRRVEPAGSPALDELRVGDNHHHIVCRRCGNTADIDWVVGARPCLTPSEVHGYVLDEAEVTFWGICPSCQSATDQDKPKRSGRTQEE